MDERRVHLSEDLNKQRPNYEAGDEVSLSQAGQDAFRALGHSDDEMSNMRGKVRKIAENGGGFEVTVDTIAGKSEVAKGIFYARSVKLGSRKVKLGPKS